jgi:hypothetical protein
MTTITGLAPPWAEARTLADLGRLTADWLEGRLEGEHPNGYDRPDDETTSLIPSLAAANRAGFVTLNSQPGSVKIVDGEVWTQWAEVTGLIADAGLLDRLVAQAWRRGIQVFVYPDWVNGGGWETPVTTRDDEPVTFSGHDMGIDEVRLHWEGCPRQAVRAAVGSARVTLVDPRSGRTDPMCQLLTALNPAA